jgi:hypothetical protein
MEPLAVLTNALLWSTKAIGAPPRCLRRRCTEDAVKLGSIALILGLSVCAVVAMPSIAGAATPVPIIYLPLVPDAIKPGSAGFTLTVNGTGFVPGAVVDWNGSPRTTTFVSGSQLQVNIPASDIAQSKTASVTVVNPAPGGSSNVEFFEVTAPTSLVPLSITSSLTLTGQPLGMIVGDFNGDGKLDMAVTNSTGSYEAKFTVFLGKGDGTFGPGTDYTIPYYVNGIASGDFNGDGKLDLAISHSFAPTPGYSGISILLGNGDGTFQTPLEFTAGQNPTSIAVGDFNGDGQLDLAVTNNGENTVSILLGNGNGTFQPAVNYTVGTSPSAVFAADFNHDGKLDLAVANQDSNTLSILLGNGDGSFKAATTYAIGTAAFSVAMADFNGDGNLDLAIANYNNPVNILLGNGDGTFRTGGTFSMPGSPATILTADLNGDGKLDLLIGQCLNGTLSLVLGNGDGTFQPPVAYPVGSCGTLAAGDFNGDGRIDVAVGPTGTNTFSVMLQKETVTLSANSLTAPNQVVGTTGGPLTVTLTAGIFPLTISGISITGTNTGDFIPASTCGNGIAAGTQCVISVSFKPTGLGPRTASLQIADNALGTPQTVALSGTGVVSGANATLVPAAITFPTQVINTTSAGSTVTLNNYGTSTLQIGGISITGTDAGDFGQSHTCGGSLGAGASCTITVTFKPKASGLRTAALSVSDNASGSPQTVSLSGTGTTAALSPASLNFGSVPISTNSAAQPVTLTNVGSSTLSITAIGITGTNAAEFAQTHTCGSSLAAGKSCSISVTFNSAAVGTFTAALSVSDNSGGSPQSVTLTGMAIRCQGDGMICGIRAARCCPGLVCSSGPYNQFGYCYK